MQTRSTYLPLPRLTPFPGGGPALLLRSTSGSTLDHLARLAEALCRRGYANGADLPAEASDVRLRLQLAGTIQATLPNMQLHLVRQGAKDSDEPAYTQRTSKGDYEPIQEPLIAYLTCGPAWVVDAGAFRTRTEARLGEHATGALLGRIAQTVGGLMPVWDSTVAYDYICECHWYGLSDDSERLSEARWEMAASHDTSPEEITDDEARDFLEGQLWTTPVVDEHLPPAYRTRRDRFRTGDDEEAAALLAAVRQCKTRTSRLQRLYDAWIKPSNYDEFFTPYPLVVTLGEEEGRPNLEVETFDEEMNRYAECGYQPGPILGIGVDPATRGSVTRFIRFLGDVSRAGEACLALLRMIDPEALRAEDARREAEPDLRSLGVITDANPIAARAWAQVARAQGTPLPLPPSAIAAE